MDNQHTIAQTAIDTYQDTIGEIVTVIALDVYRVILPTLNMNTLSEDMTLGYVVVDQDPIHTHRLVNHHS